jgi:hypothetical protein
VGALQCAQPLEQMLADWLHTHAHTHHHADTQEPECDLGSGPCERNAQLPQARCPLPMSPHRRRPPRPLTGHVMQQGVVATLVRSRFSLRFAKKKKKKRKENKSVHRDESGADCGPNSIMRQCVGPPTRGHRVALRELILGWCGWTKWPLACCSVSDTGLSSGGAPPQLGLPGRERNGKKGGFLDSPRHGRQKGLADPGSSPE